MNLIKYRNWFFALSLLVIIPGIIALSTWGLKLGIDFAGVTLWEIKFEKEVNDTQIKSFLTGEGVEFSSVAETQSNSFLIRLKVSDETKINDLKSKLGSTFGTTEDVRLETVGPVISRELTQKAFLAVALSIIGIVVYITWA